MKIGVSTASLFGRFYTEGAIEYLNKKGVPVAEVFLESYSEYNRDFGKLLSGVKGDIDAHSVHVLNTQYEPQLYSVNVRAKEDSFKLLDGAMSAAEEIGAKYYTFHGVARMKKTPFIINFERVGSITQDIIEVCKKHGVTLAYENVHWCYYNYIGFFNEVRKRTVGLKGTLDIKQARQSGIEYKEFIKEMGSDIVTVHLSDVDKNGKMCLPGKGVTDFYDLFSRLHNVGFDGAMLIECYQNDFKDFSEIEDSLDFLREIKQKVYK